MSQAGNLSSPDPSFAVSTLRGLRNGLYYGGKVRFMHSLVMTLLFKKGDLKAKLLSIWTLTFEHAKNLGLYVLIYKSVIYLLKTLQGEPKKFHSFIAGCIGGFIMFRHKTNVNYQIILYLLSRNIVAGAESLVRKGKLPNKKAFPVLATLCWGIVMYLFEDDAAALQPSLKSSMDFLYKQSETYKDWTDFVPVAVPRAVKSAINQAFVSRGTSQK